MPKLNELLDFNNRVELQSFAFVKSVTFINDNTSSYWLGTRKKFTKFFLKLLTRKYIRFILIHLVLSIYNNNNN